MVGFLPYTDSVFIIKHFLIFSEYFQSNINIEYYL